MRNEKQSRAKKKKGKDVVQSFVLGVILKKTVKTTATLIIQITSR